MNRGNRTFWYERLVANQHPHPETLPRELPRRPEAAQSQRPPFLVHDIRFPIDDIRQSLPLLQLGNDRLDRIGRTEGIAGVDEPDIISRRLLKPLVHGIVYPLVRLAHPIGQPRFIPSDDLQYRYSADFDWCIRCMKQARSFCNTHLTLSDFLDGGTSTTQRKASLRERYAIMCKYYGTFVTVLLHGWFAIRFYTAKCLKGRV